jgi:hypothetical protein
MPVAKAFSSAGVIFSGLGVSRSLLLLIAFSIIASSSLWQCILVAGKSGVSGSKHVTEQLNDISILNIVGWYLKQLNEITAPVIQKDFA